MTPRLLIAVLVIASLAGCASRFNPLNWFGGDREERVVVDTPEVVTDRRALVAEVIRLEVSPLPSGAIVSAVGLPPRQGFWEADLVETSRENGNLTLEFRVFPPVGNTPASTQRSREVLAGASLSRQDLAGIRSITVIGQQNRRTVRRQ